MKKINNVSDVYNFKEKEQGFIFLIKVTEKINSQSKKTRVIAKNYEIAKARLQLILGNKFSLEFIKSTSDEIIV